MNQTRFGAAHGRAGEVVSKDEERHHGAVVRGASSSAGWFVQTQVAPNHTTAGDLDRAWSRSRRLVVRATRMDVRR